MATNATLTFDDEFNTLSLGNPSTNTWQPAINWAPNGLTDPTISSWTMSPTWGPTSAPDANVYSVNNGALSIAFKPTPADVKLSDVGGKEFLSGQLTTNHSFAQTYGYFEANMKLPAAAGLNSAFWLLPADGSWPPELDVAEVLGNDPTTLVMTAHSAATGTNTANPQWATIPNASQAFHTYAVDWEADKITWYFDGKQMAQEATPADMHKPMYVLLDTLSGASGSWPGTPNAGETAHMDVNYVRAYSSNPNAVAVTPQAGYVPDNGAPVTAVASAPASAPTVPPATAPTAALGTDTLVLSLAEDAWQGDAQAVVTLDGKTIGGTLTVTALHSQGKTQAVTLTGQWGPGAHDVGVQFINDAYGGTSATDRNLYVNAVSYDGQASATPPATLLSNGAAHAATQASPLVLQLSEDAYLGDAQFSLTVDGKAQGAAQSVTTLHSSGSAQDFGFNVAMPAGTHDVAVSFLNDAYAGTAATDRNLYVNAVDANGAAMPSTAAALMSNGTQHFSIVVPAHA